MIKSKKERGKGERAKKDVSTMKMLSLPINAIVVFNHGDRPQPREFRYVERDGSMQDVKVDQVLYVEEKNRLSNPIFIYHCQSTIRGMNRRYELKYFLRDARWELLKM